MSELQFDRAEYEQAAPAPVCAQCERQLLNSYFQVNDSIVCEACAYTAQHAGESGSGFSRGMRAVGAGLAAAILGGALYYAVAALSGYEFGLIAIVVGLGVGAAVRWGSNGRGGWRYQTLAMALTYLAIVSTYVPYIIKGIDEAQVEATEQVTTGDVSTTVTATPAAADAAAQPSNAPAQQSNVTVQQASLGQALFAIGILLAIACVAPFLAGLENIMGLIIIGIGLYEAWKLNKRTPLVVTGPHPVRAMPTPAAV